ncbi:hypothetical protein [Maricaulis maris]|uniref:hypothetical protein n=1 Tax=Maricaulis maris TaxID=74318 RepID=UPI003B8DB729
MRHFLVALFGFAALSSASAAQDMEAFESALAGLAGHWSGVLAYRDYQSGERTEIPHERSTRLAPDGSYMITELAFTDPGYRVFGAELLTIESGRLIVASVGSGGAEMVEADLVAFTQSETGWSAELSSRGHDNNAPADILYLIEVSADFMRQTKRVRATGAEEFEFRNAIEVRRAVVPG